MIVTCPACSTRYLVDPLALGSGGRSVRCARCRTTWHEAPPPEALQSAPSPIEQTDEPPPPSPPAEDDAQELRSGLRTESRPAFAVRPASTPPRLPAVVVERRPLVRIIAAVAVVVLLLLIGSALLLHGEIVASWPVTRGVYAALGLQDEAPGAGLKFSDVSSSLAQRNGIKTLVLTGKIANVVDTARPVPEVLVTLRDKNGKVVKTWQFAVSRATLLPGETTPFETTLATPPPDITSAGVTFAE